jgi:hypothetical protein
VCRYRQIVGFGRDSSLGQTVPKYDCKVLSKHTRTTCPIVSTVTLMIPEQALDHQAVVTSTSGAWVLMLHQTDFYLHLRQPLESSAEQTVNFLTDHLGPGVEKASLVKLAYMLRTRTVR